MTDRKRFTAKFRREFFAKHNGVCSICNGRVDPRTEAFEIEHTNPLALTGTNDDDNLTLVHSKCHKSKTRDDVARIAKAKRQERKDTGAGRPAGDIKSAGFAPSAKKPAIDKSSLPKLQPRKLYA